LKNIRKLYAYSFFQMFLVVMPIIVPFWQAKGLTLQEIFTLQGIFGFCLIVFDVPAGYAADLFGRKKTMILGALISAIGFQVLWLGQTFLHYAIYEIIVGLGISFQSGCDVALLYSSLEDLGLSRDRASFLGKRLTAMTLGEGFAALAGGALAAHSLDWPAYANGITACIPVFIGFSIHEPERAKLTRVSHVENFKFIGRALFGHSRLLTWVIFNFIFYGFATYCAIWCLQPYWKALEIPVSWFGYLWASIAFAVALVSRYAHKVERKLGPVKTIVAIAVLPIIGYLGMGLTRGFVGLLLMLAFPICRGLNQVLFQDAINTRVPQEIRATTNSVGSLGMRMLFIVFGPVLGFILDKHGVSEAFIVMGAIYIVGFFAVAGGLLKQRTAFEVR
jgi:MFS family permease